MITETVAGFLLIFLAVLLCAACHSLVKNYFFASLVSAVLVSVGGEVISYIELGSTSPWSVLTVTLSFVYGFVLALMVGIPFHVSRKRRTEKTEETK